MLKRDPSGRFLQSEGRIFTMKRLWRFYSGKRIRSQEIDDEAYKAILLRQRNRPTLVMTDHSSGKRWWMFNNEFYWEDEHFSTSAVEALILELNQKREKKVRRAVANIQQNGDELSTMRQLLGFAQVM